MDSEVLAVRSADSRALSRLSGIRVIAVVDIGDNAAEAGRIAKLALHAGVQGLLLSSSEESLSLFQPLYDLIVTGLGNQTTPSSLKPTPCSEKHTRTWFGYEIFQKGR